MSMGSAPPLPPVPDEDDEDDDDDELLAPLPEVV
jgi:hypothetical protein